MKSKINEIINGLMVTSIIGLATMTINNSSELNAMNVKMDNMVELVSEIKEKLPIERYEKDREQDEKMMTMNLELTALRLKNEMKKEELLNTGNL